MEETVLIDHPRYELVVPSSFSINVGVVEHLKLTFFLKEIMTD
jgi:hypothetical protein